MNPKEILQLFNTATRDELIALSGIGPSLADRILEARPFAALEDVEAVRGISARIINQLTEALPPQTVEEGKENLAERISGMRENLDEKIAQGSKSISEGISTMRENLDEKIAQGSKSISEGVSTMRDNLDERTQAAREAVQAIPDRFNQTSRSRGMFWTIMVSNIASAFLAIILTLMIIGGINGSLRFATHDQYRSMQSEAGHLSTQIEAMQQDLEGVRSRVDTLEGLGERTVALEKAQQQLALDLETTTQNLENIQTDMDGLKEQLSQQEERTVRFESFLKELKALLANLFTTEGVTQ